MPEQKLFTIERIAHSKGEVADAMERYLPIVVWVEVPPVAPGDNFPCGGPVYLVHPESIAILFRNIGRDPALLDLRNKSVCGCMGRLSE